MVREEWLIPTQRDWPQKRHYSKEKHWARGIKKYIKKRMHLKKAFRIKKNINRKNKCTEMRYGTKKYQNKYKIACNDKGRAGGQRAVRSAQRNKTRRESGEREAVSKDTGVV